MEEAGELVLAAVEEAAGAEAAVPGARQVAVLCEAAGRAQQQDCGHAQQGQRNTRGGHGESVERPGLLDRALSAPGIYPPPPSPFPPHTASDHRVHPPSQSTLPCIHFYKHYILFNL